MFDFLRDTVSKVPDLGGPDAAGEDRSATKRRLGCIQHSCFLVWGKKSEDRNLYCYLSVNAGRFQKMKSMVMRMGLKGYAWYANL